MEANGVNKNDLLPHDPQRSAMQVRGLLEHLAHPPKRVLELGCGNGRVLVPLAQAGHHMIGIDHDPNALTECRRLLAREKDPAELIEVNFIDWLRSPTVDAGFDAIICVGNTFMTIADLDHALDVLTHARQLLAPGGAFIMDDLPHDLWPEVAQGNWQTGISEDGSSQMIWHPNDTVFTIRRGQRIDLEAWEFKPDDVLYRLWTSSGVSMAARIAGLSEPMHIPEAALLVLHAANA